MFSLTFQVPNDFHVHLSCHKKKKWGGVQEKKNEVKLEFLTLEKSLKMFLVCTLMDQKAEGKEKKKRRSLKMP